MSLVKYKEISKDEIPDGVRFDVTRKTAGQMIQVAYGGFSRYEHGHGDSYKRIIDRSNLAVTYYRREG